MKKSKILLPLACLSMLLVACNGKGSASSDSQPASSGSQSQPSTSQPTSSSQGGGASSSSSAASSSSSSSQAAHEHNFQAVGNAVKNSAGKDVKLSACECGAKMISIEFKDYTTCGGTDGTNPWYMKKGESLTWNISVDKEIKGATLYLGLIATSDDHMGRHLYNEAKEDAKHEGEAGYVSQNTGSNPDTLEQDDTRFTIDVGDKNYPLTNKKTMEENGAVKNQVCYVDVTNIDLAAGDNVLKYTQGLKIGYRMRLNGEVRILYQGDAKPVAAPQGYTVTFVTSHAKAMVYESGKDYTKAPVESTTTKTRDENGNIAEYVAEDVDAGIAEVKPQVNFQIVCDAGYAFDDGIDRSTLEVDATDPSIKSVDVKPNKVSWISPADNYNKLKLIEKTNTDGSVAYYYRTTKVKGELTITLNAYQPIAQPTGSYHGQVKLLAALGGAYQPVDMELTQNGVELCINGQFIPVTSYEWNDKEGKISVVTAEASNFGTLTATYNKEQNSFTVTGVSGTNGQGLDPDVTVVLYGHGLFYDCNGTTAELQDKFQRRYWRPGQENSWQKDNGNSDRVSADTEHYLGKEGGNGVKLRPCAGQSDKGEKYRVSISLKGDFAEPVPTTSLSFWVYNPGESDITLRAWGYLEGNYGENRFEYQANTTLTAKAGAWTYMNLSYWKDNAPQRKSIYNFQVANFNGSDAALTFENFCLL